MVLYIDTKERKSISVSLKQGNKVIKSLTEENEFGSQVLLPLIEKIVDVNWKILEAVEVETGSGSFTGIRVGVSVANALAFALGIPVNGKKTETEINY